MKTKLLLVCSAALTLAGCATYSGGTNDQYGTVSGTDTSYYVNPHEPDMLGIRPFTTYEMPVRKQGSPNGQDMGDARPEFRFYY
jgi:hypothetical protein